MRFRTSGGRSMNVGEAEEEELTEGEGESVNAIVGGMGEFGVVVLRVVVATVVVVVGVLVGVVVVVVVVVGDMSLVRGEVKHGPAARLTPVGDPPLPAAAATQLTCLQRLKQR